MLRCAQHDKTPGCHAERSEASEAVWNALVCMQNERKEVALQAKGKFFAHSLSVARSYPTDPTHLASTTYGESPDYVMILIIGAVSRDCWINSCYRETVCKEL